MKVALAVIFIAVLAVGLYGAKVNGWLDIPAISTVADPASGWARLFLNPASGLLDCRAADGSTCVPWARSGTVVGLANAGDSVSIGSTVLGASGLLVPVTVSTTTPISPTVAGFYCNNSSGAITYNLPAISSAKVGLQMCFRNAVTRTGAITLQAPASTYIDKDGANGTVAGTIVSGGAAGDAACAVAVSTTQYMVFVSRGTWTNN